MHFIKHYLRTLLILAGDKGGCSKLQGTHRTLERHSCSLHPWPWKLWLHPMGSSCCEMSPGNQWDLTHLFSHTCGVKGRDRNAGTPVVKVGCSCLAAEHEAGARQPWKWSLESIKQTPTYKTLFTYRWCTGRNNLLIVPSLPRKAWQL